MSIDAIIWLSGLVYVFSSFGLLRAMMAEHGFQRSERWLVLAIAFTWPVWAPLVFLVALVVVTANGVWEVL